MTMYTPSHFSELNGERLAKLIERYGFATLLTAAGEDMHISHVPLLLDRHRGPQGTLLGHFARANPHATALKDGDAVTALFHGPHGYVSPTWYAAPGVPTWNYAAVHVHGTVRRVEDANAKWQIITRLSAQYETGSANPWNPELKKEQWWKMLDAIVGFEIAITAIEAKFKLSQNRARKDQENVIARLDADAHPDSHAMAAMMRENLARKKSV